MEASFEKARLRRDLRKNRDGVEADRRAVLDRQVFARLTVLPEFFYGARVLVYLSAKGEVGTDDIVRACLARGLIVAAPVVRNRNGEMLAYPLYKPEGLSKGAFGIREPASDRDPVAPSELDLFLIPGVGFSPTGARLGYGGGYYDRFLAQRRAGAVIIGLAYDLQVVPRIPMDKHDVRVNIIVTPTRVIRVGHARN